MRILLVSAVLAASAGGASAACVPSWSNCDDTSGAYVRSFGQSSNDSYGQQPKPEKKYSPYVDSPLDTPNMRGERRLQDSIYDTPDYSGNRKLKSSIFD